MFYTASLLKQHETTEALKSCYGAHYLATVYHSQLKARTQLAGESLQKFVTTIAQLTHCALPRLAKHCIWNEAGHTFVTGISDGDMNQQLLMGSERILSKVLRQDLPLKATKTAARMFITLQQMSNRTTWRNQPNATESTGDWQLIRVRWHCESTGQFCEDCLHKCNENSDA